jgi:anionic cell wall polymer biosynthesis LytR-Cps2A-Psr (LCP) family protein
MHDSDSGVLLTRRQHMTGDAALRFSRDRHDFPQSDIIRTNNQGLVILAGIEQMQKSAKRTAGQFHLITLLYQRRSFQNLGVTDLYRLGRLIQDVKVSNIRNVTIPIGGGNCPRSAVTHPASSPTSATARSSSH